ncbi:hypothetical protein Tco_1165566 [Tanacetum coccineum]
MFCLLVLYVSTAKKGFLSPKGRGRGNGVKEKHSTLSNDPNKDQNHVIVLSSRAMATNVCLDAPIPGSYNFDSTSGKQTDVRADLAKLSSINQSSSVDTSVENSMGPVSYGSSSYATSVIELRADTKWKDTLVVVVPKFIGEGYTMSTIRVEYKWTHPRCSSYKVFCHVMDECSNKIISNLLKNLKTERQAVKGVHVGSKLGSNLQLKLTKQVYQLVSKKNGAS